MAKLRDMVIDTLIEAGIDHVFGMPGGGAMFYFDPLFDRQDKIKTVLARHEGAASCMADMYGRLTGKPGVVICQGAWAGSNVVLGCMEAYLAGVPMLVLTDFSDYAGLVQHMPYQCQSGEYGSVDLPSIMRSCTKYTTVAHHPTELIHGVQLAIKHAITGKPGPTCVISRWNVITSEADPATLQPKLYPLAGFLNVSPPCSTTENADKIADLLLQAQDPVMVCGRGIHVSRCYPEVQEIAELLGMPVATSFMGQSAIPETHPLALGPTGNSGQKIANEKVSAADLIFAVGTGLAPENNKMLAPEFINAERQKIVQIDIEPLNIGFTYPVTLGVTSEAGLALRMIIKAIKSKTKKIDAASRIAALQKLKAEKNFFKDPGFTSDEVPIAPERVVKDLNDALGQDSLVVLDGGNNRMWMTRHFQCKAPGQIIAAGGCTAVGWGVAASLAAAMLKPDKKVVCVSGDGGMNMHLHMLESAAQYNVPIKYLVLNNSCLGNVMDFQPPNRRLATEYPTNDFATIARAAGCEGFRVEKAEDIKPALHEALGNGKPTLIDVRVNKQPHFKLMMG